MKLERAVVLCKGPRRSPVQRAPQCFKICACYCSPHVSLSSSGSWGPTVSPEASLACPSPTRLCRGGT